MYYFQNTFKEYFSLFFLFLDYSKLFVKCRPWQYFFCFKINKFAVVVKKLAYMCMIYFAYTCQQPSTFFPQLWCLLADICFHLLILCLYFRNWNSPLFKEKNAELDRKIRTLGTKQESDNVKLTGINEKGHSCYTNQARM